MVNDKIKLNTIVEIEGENGEKYLCRVLDESKDTISVDIPVCGMEYLLLERNEIVEIQYLVENECYYKGDSKVLKRYKNNINMYMLTRPINLKKIQRRNFVRAKTLDNIKYKSVSRENKKWYSGIMLDLSGGGMRVSLKEEVKVGEKLQINIYDEHEKIELDGVVVRVEETDHVYGIEFDAIDERKRDRVVKKVFTIMVKERKRI